MDGKPNRLINEKSPYLLQHAYNPVDWYPWSEEAFQKAGKEAKPIFLSIGYSTCHWCHVMEKESFEDTEVASLMNDAFVSIKVDREERPDIDSIYMSFCQVMTGSGGWPLTIIMTPDKKPFFAATYIPKENRFGRSGMMDIIPKIKELWNDNRGDLEISANKITEALKDIPGGTKEEILDESTLKLAYNQLLRNYDKNHGGFSNAPKFPSPHNLLFLLRYWKRTDDSRALSMVESTLQNMHIGGIYDQIGFGFHRYSTDHKWLVPHFEKMLYDQALLAMAYTEAYQATGNNVYARVVKEIFSYVLRDMTSQEGGFYSAEDADSEGEEGKFYLWSTEELSNVLDKKDTELIQNIYNMENDGNFIDQIAGIKIKMNILHLTKPLNEIATQLKLKEKDLKERLEEARIKLFNHREKRVHPYKDDKIITDWNGLMIAALAKGGAALNMAEYVKAASKAADFILNRMYDSKTNLLHRFRDGEAAISAHLDDYSFFIWGLIELYEATFKPEYLEQAVKLTDELLSHFWDSKDGGFYYTADNAEDLVLRQKEISDGAIPSGNGVAFLNLLRLAKLTGTYSYEEKASELQKAFSFDIIRVPLGHTMMMVGLDFALGRSFEVIIKGAEGAQETMDMLNALRTNFIPNIIIHLNPEKSKTKSNVMIPELNVNNLIDEDGSKAYICSNYSCQNPVTDKNEMLEILGIKSK